MPHKKHHRTTVNRSSTSPDGPTSSALIAKMAFNPQDLLTDVEAAQFLRLKPYTLRVWRSTNRKPALRYVRLSRKCVRYLFSDLLAFVEANKNQVAA